MMLGNWLNIKKYLRTFLSGSFLLIHASTSQAEAVDLSKIQLEVIDPEAMAKGQSLIFGPPRAVELSEDSEPSAKKEAEQLSNSEVDLTSMAPAMPDDSLQDESKQREPAAEAVAAMSAELAELRSRAPIRLSIDPHIWFYNLVMTDQSTSAQAELSSSANVAASFEARFALQSPSHWTYAVHADLRKSTMVAPAGKTLEQSDEYIWGAGIKADYQLTNGLSASLSAMLEQGLFARAIDFSTLRVEQVTRPTVGVALNWNFLEWRKFSSEAQVGYQFLLPATTSIYSIFSGRELSGLLRIKMLQDRTVWSTWLGYARQSQANSLTQNERADLLFGLGCQLTF